MRKRRWNAIMNGNMETANLMTAKELAQFLRLSEDHIRRMVSQRTIPFVRIGRMVRFASCDIDKWLATKRVYTKNEINQLAVTRTATKRKRI